MDEQSLRFESPTGRNWSKPPIITASFVAAIGDEDDRLRSQLVGQPYRVEYRAFLVDIDGQCVGCEPIICADDTEAIETAAGLVDGHDIEVWSGPGFAPF
jgi:hypothetical protein